MGKKILLGEILVAEGLVTGDVINIFLERQKTSGKKLGEMLVLAGVVTEEQVVAALTKQSNNKAILL